MDDSIKDALSDAGLGNYFDSLPPSHQKEYLKWIYEAKKENTKQKRVLKMIEMLKAKRNT